MTRTTDDGKPKKEKPNINGGIGAYGNLPGPGPGRPKGSVGVQAPTKVRQVLKELADNLAPEIEKWIKEIASHPKGGPVAALNAYTQLLEFSIPKLARTETVNLDLDGQTAATKEQRDAAVKAVLAADE